KNPVKPTDRKARPVPRSLPGVIRAWLPYFFTCGLARMGRENRSNLHRFLRPAAGYFLLVFGFWFLVFGFWFLVFVFARVARSIKPCRRSRHCFFGPFVPARSLAKPIASFG